MRTIAELSDALHARRVSSVELVAQALARIDAAQPTLNAFITVDAEGALERARSADGELAGGDARPLTGIPIAHKDVLMTAGMRTTCASRMLASFVAPYDAHVVSKLRDAGTVLVAQDDLSQFGVHVARRQPALRARLARSRCLESAGSEVLTRRWQQIPAAT